MLLQCRRHQVVAQPSPDTCPLAKGNACKPYGRLHVVISDDDPLGSYVFHTTDFNSIRKEINPVSLNLLVSRVGLPTLTRTKCGAPTTEQTILNADVQ